MWIKKETTQKKFVMTMIPIVPDFVRVFVNYMYCPIFESEEARVA